MMVKVKLGSELYAVLVRSCSVANAIDTILFGDVDAAKTYCNVKWKVPLDGWDGYMVTSDLSSPVKLNGEPVRYCGWVHYKDETETLHIHLNQKVVEF